MADEKGRPDLIHGTLDLLILKTLRNERLHGWAISRRIAVVSGDILQVNQGSLYPALYRLEDREWIVSEWGRAENGRRVKLYRLTRRGLRQLERERRYWEEFVVGVTRILAVADGGE